LNASTVDNLLALANQALRNIPLASIDADACLTYSNINDALDAINNAFDECAHVCNCQ
jgi:hypothetical protein